MKVMLAVAALAAFAFATGTLVAEAAPVSGPVCAQACAKGCLKRYPGGGGHFDACKERCVTLKCNR